MNERSIFLAALDIDDPAERAAYVARACGGDPALRASVAELLSHHGQAGSFLGTVPRDPNMTAGLDRTASEEPGGMVGAYRLMERLGEGGMGQVFVAEQTDPVRRRVALKLIKRGMDSREVVARFEAERQALALMDHPNIAKVLDGGTTEGGRPYFVLELVRGQPITNYCDANHLSVRDRLGLFVQVCRAVQHAHQKGIIHRDIKPSNILVTEHDGKPVAKVIDFGVAKAVGAHLTDKTVYTGFMQLIGTPLYMSPEQAGMSGLDIDTRSDIYSLGVLLYELLTGTTPFDKDRIRQVGYDELRRIIREEEPARPSARLSTLQAEASTVSANRATDPRRLSRLVRGELDWVAMKCLEKDRNRRYESAAALAADIERYLADEPVQACPPSAAYRLRKFVSRNKAAVGAASALAVVLLLAVAGLATSNYLLTQANKKTETALEQKKEEEARATEEARQKGEALERVSQEKAKVDWEKIRADRNKNEALANLGEARRAVKELLLNVAMNFHFQGLQNTERVALLASAIPTLERFVKQQADSADIKAEQGRAYDDLAFLRAEMGLPQQALADADHAVAIFRRLTETHQKRPEFRTELALALNSRAKIIGDLRHFDASVEAQREAIGLVERLAAEYPKKPEYREHLGMMLNNLGVLLKDTDRVKEAIPVLRRAVTIRNELVEEQAEAARVRVQSARSWPKLALATAEGVRWSARFRLQLAKAWVSLGGAFSAQREHGLAEEAYKEALQVLAHETLKPRHDDQELVQAIAIRGMAANNLAVIEYKTGRHKEAVVRFREAIREKESLAVKFPSVPRYRNDLAGCVMNLGSVLNDLNQWDDAQKANEQAVRIYERLVRDYRSVPEYAVRLAGAYSNLGGLIGERGGLEKALPMLDLAVATLEPFHRADERDVKVRESLYAVSFTRALTLSGLGRHRDAQPDWDRAVELAPADEVNKARIKRASNLLNLKEYARVLADAEAVAESPKATGEYLFYAAGCFAIAANELRGNKAAAEAHAARAVALLRAAMVKGYHGTPDQLYAIKDLRALHDRQDFRKLIEEEEAICREAIKASPKDPVRYYTLSQIVNQKGRHAEALEALKTAIVLRQDYPEAHEMRGFILDELGDFAGAEAAYWAAIKCYTDKEGLARAYMNLAGVLGKQQRQPEAVELFRKAIEVRPRFAQAHFGLGTALGEQGRTRESIAALEKAVECDEKGADAHGNLGFALMLAGEYAEAKVSLKRSHDLAPPNHPLRATMQRLMANCDRLNAFAQRLPALLEGKDEPASDAERVGFADVCLARGHYAVAARLYVEALRPQAKPPAVYREDAARAAVLAASGPRLPFGLLERQRTALREQARDWLVEETDTWEGRTPQGRARIHKKLALWQRHPEFATVRDKDELARLPAQEQAEWRRFWGDVQTFINMVKPKGKAESPKK